MRGLRTASAWRPARRRGWTLLETLVTALVAMTLAVVLVRQVLDAREAARMTTCRGRLSQLALAVNNYEDTHQTLPPAAIWRTDRTASLALHRSKQVDVISQASWVSLLLPYVDSADVQQLLDESQPMGAPENAAARLVRLASMECMTDHYNRDGNEYELPGRGGASPIRFARGNYAINGGTHNISLESPDTAFPRGDVPHLVIDPEKRTFQMWGNGVAGINRAFRRSEFANGASTLVLLEELRAGIHPLDPRGVWSLGQIGGSITWGHGVNGDDGSPNHQWPRSDDLLGCRELHEAVGTRQLLAEGMPCVDYVDANQQATSRSLHKGLVNVAFLDGSVRSISDRIDPGLWHVMHSHETPAGHLAGVLIARMNAPRESPPVDAAARPGRVNGAAPPAGPLTNSLGMPFVVVPAGEFLMGQPDGQMTAPPECPSRRVQISRPFLLGVHEVTRGQLAAVMGRPAPDSGDRLPATDVTWDEAVEFCERLSALPEEQQAGRRYRLPTEAEWEYACRGGQPPSTGRGEALRPLSLTGESAGRYPGLPLAEVGSWPANELGLFDMRGNAWEWTSDWFCREWDARNVPADPQGPAAGDLKVVRGSDWRYVGEVCLLDSSVMPPWKGNPIVGFRVVCETR
ncbi:MAG: SUMF1/EgtB/PvdO family nonheme iron enzyme [Planctomyces sp.]|nr:SUMF1/EgtB/PvdO family nonheme iron enzyme [Planctomyces sp.]